MIYVSASFLLILIIMAAGLTASWFSALLNWRDPSRQFTAWRIATVRRRNRRWVVDVKFHMQRVVIGGFWWRWQANHAARGINREHFKNGEDYR